MFYYFEFCGDIGGKKKEEKIVKRQKNERETLC